MLNAPTSPAPVGRPRRQYSSSHSSDELHSGKTIGQLPIGVRRAQDWLHARFANVLPEDFLDRSVLFYTAQVLEAPIGFESIWGGVIGTRFRSGAEATARIEEHEMISTALVVVLLADLQDKEQMKSVIDMADFVNRNFTDDAPLLVYAPHSVCPEVRKPVDLMDSMLPLMSVLDDGVDEVLTGEPEGIKLALEVQNRVLVQQSLMQKFKDDSDTPEEQERRARKKSFLEEVMHDTVWDYMRVRLQTKVPAIDWSIPPETPRQIENYVLGTVLGNGSFGTVYRLEYADGDREPTGSVLKVVPKKRMCDVASLYKVKHQLEVMHILTVDWPHPNVSKLHSVYHSETHLFFELEDCGPLDLYKHYRKCEQTQCPLSIAKTHAIIQQMTAAVCHMHTKPKVTHCDLKPENIIINETPNNVLIKISDFDTARADPVVPQYGIVGTFPFSAPEIILDRKFDPYAADIWSLGLILLESLCFSQVLEVALQLNSGNRARCRREKLEIRRQMMIKIQTFFSHKEAVGCLLQENIRHGLHDILSHSFLLLLQDMLNVSHETRLRADKLTRAVL